MASSLFFAPFDPMHWSKWPKTLHIPHARASDRERKNGPSSQQGGGQLSELRQLDKSPSGQMEGGETAGKHMAAPRIGNTGEQRAAVWRGL